jgi:uncharacterized protein
MQPQLSNAFTIFLSLLVEALPFLLLGVIFSGVLSFLVSERRLVSLLPRNPILGAIVGSGIGFLFPVCECGNIPVARRLLIRGVPAPVAISFLFAAPTINPIVIWVTWTAFRDQPEIVGLRVGCSLLIAIVLGILFSVQTDIRPFLQTNVGSQIPAFKPVLLNAVLADQPEVKEHSDTPALLQSGTFWLEKKANSSESDDAPFQPTTVDEMRIQALDQADVLRRQGPFSNRFSQFLLTIMQEFSELGGVLVIGSAIAALLQVYIPRDVILSLGQGPITSILAMMLLAATVSICSTVDSFFALSFASAFTGGSLLAFLVFGPIIDLKAIGLLLSIFRVRTIVYILAIAAQLTFALALFINYYIT